LLLWLRTMLNRIVDCQGQLSTCTLRLSIKNVRTTVDGGGVSAEVQIPVLVRTYFMDNPFLKHFVWVKEVYCIINFKF
jgi:hypothetical protein